ncbi:MAG: VWA domain-containing protein, partial [Planctomycetes bacterium]|nr:VWA domain-containing protein [Planctomycetota bacterium]
MEHTKLILNSQVVSAPTWWQVVVLATCAVAVISAVIFYLRVARLLRPTVLAALLGLRLAAVLVLILSLLEPVLSVERVQTERTGLALLVDTSRSMGIADYPNLPSRLEQVKRALLAKDTAIDRLQRSFKVSWYAFDAQPRQLPSRDAVRALAAEGEATNLTATVRAAARELKAGDYAGVILFSDGQDNTEKDPVRELVPEGVPVYAVGVGTDLRRSGQFTDVVL